MMNDTLDEQCALAMGWVKRYSPDPTIYVWEKPNGERVTAADLPNFSGNWVASGWLLNDIEWHGLQDAYLAALSRILDDVPLPYNLGKMPPFLWLVLRATPETRARAFIEVMRRAAAH